MATKIGIDKTHGFMQEIINNQFERKTIEVEKSSRQEAINKKLEEFETHEKEEVKRKREERRKKREKIPTMQTYVPPSQRKVQITPPKYLGKSVFKMDIEYRPNKFAPIKIRENECIKKACELFVSRYDVSPDTVPALELHIGLHMGLVSIPA